MLHDGQDSGATMPIVGAGCCSPTMGGVPLRPGWRGVGREDPAQTPPDWRYHFMNEYDLGKRLLVTWVT